ncbi:MAG: hypothetical protein J1E56_03965 [Ruminococcus sp.]|nr:hypothetical protein [Ruminococcus sp.]
MNNKTFKYLEISGAAVTFLIWFVLHHINSLESDHLLNLFFGSANNSVWESIKLYLLAFLVWSMIELCWIIPQFRTFVVIKTFLVYGMGLLYCIVITLLQLWGVTVSGISESACIMIFSVIIYILSYNLLIKNPEVSCFFVPCLFMLLLFSVSYVCFTPYPLKIPVFFDFQNRLYGIIPTDFDRGAIFLDSLYGN